MPLKVTLFDHHFVSLPYIIANRGEWLWNPTSIKGANKDFKIYVGRFTTVHNLLFCPHTLCMNYVTNTFLLVSSSVRRKQLLCFVHGQGQKREQKHTTKNFHEFRNHSPLLTMLISTFLWDMQLYILLYIVISGFTCNNNNNNNNKQMWKGCTFQEEMYEGAWLR